MGSTRPTDRSLGETTFLPQWMKGKLDKRFDYTDSTFSPPADEAGFFYIRYPKHEETSSNNNKVEQKEGFRPINELFDHAEAKSVDLSTEPKIVVANKPKTRPTANDDFNNSTTSECGRSIVHVASQIMSSKFSKSTSSDSTSSNSEEIAAQQHRRGSKSLPATPLTSPNITPDSSPKSRRRNRFFAGAFVPVEGTEGRKNGWLLSSILGQSRELITSTKIDEEEEMQPDPLSPRIINRKKSISSQNLTYVGNENKVPKVYLQPKPSELREMNFWSPTSM
ncbi:uncharacterized protein LOC131674408 isoform X2 [Phymastichus coffea]|uniref:uncharacterized protein LOC131674408 isoform X2 n=1 Tax=Phymastichus coffea TaxID=108790 RepID=UPI00273CF43B|nr:uncharacterized protein LOC131674408 isoform X2 [Phymastichus coffea]